MQSGFSAAGMQYPIHVHGRFDRPSRGLWLIKWLLALPHYIVLAFLWIGFLVSAVASFLAVLFSGHYPRPLFDYNVGVLRWSWRVAFYAYGANGTDRYPPFTLGEAPDYPALLEIDYPEHQRKGFPLIGWWLAGIPQYIVAGVLLGGVVGWADRSYAWVNIGVIALLVLIAALVLLFRGEYPRQMFDFVLGLNRWVIRAAAYAAVMTPEYPPFRIDVGEDEPSSQLLVSAVTAGAPGAADAAAADAGAEADTATRAVTAGETAGATTAGATTAGATTPAPRWGAGRITVVVIAGLLTLISLFAIVGGITAIVFDRTQRGADGFVMTSASRYSTSTYALVSGSYRGGSANDAAFVRSMLGKVRITATSTSAMPVFVGIAPAASVDRYLANAAYAHGSRFDTRNSAFGLHAGGAPPTTPVRAGIWAAAAAGTGTQTVSWTPRSGNWDVVVMNADGSRAVEANVAVGARLPHLMRIGLIALGGGILLLALSCAAAGIAARGARV